MQNINFRFNFCKLFRKDKAMTDNTKTTSRRLRIDSFRFYAIFLIVIGHAGTYIDPFPTEFLSKAGKASFGLGVRYAIPFFFILAGYFIGGKIIREPGKKLAIARKYIARLVLIYIFWFLVYAVERPQEFLQLVREEPLLLIFEGSKYHLWFIVSLILTVCLFALWPTRKGYKSFLWLGGILYLVGLLSAAYKNTPIGFDMHFNTRNGIFFSTLFFAIGVLFSDRLPRMNRKTALGIAVGGLVLTIVEALFLRMVFEVRAQYFDYLFSTVPFGVGMSLFCLTQPDTRFDKLFGSLGKYTLGIYASHVLFIDLLVPIDLLFSPSALQMIWRFAYPFLVFGLSLLATFVLSVVLAKTPLRGIVQ